MAAEEGAGSLFVTTSCRDAGLHRVHVEGPQRQIPNWYELDWDHVDRARAAWVAPGGLDLVLEVRRAARGERRAIAPAARDAILRFPSAQSDEAGRRGREAAHAEIKGAPFLLEVDVKPLAPGGGRSRSATASRERPTPAWRDLRDDGVDDESVHSAVPGYVDEPDQTCGLKPQTQPRL